MSKLNIWDFKKNPTLRGTYASLFMGMGKFKTTVFHIREKKTGKIVSVWGHQNIRLFLSWQPIGAEIEIKFLGIKKKKGKDGKPRKVFDYKCRVLKTKKTIIGNGRGRPLALQAKKRP